MFEKIRSEQTIRAVNNHYKMNGKSIHEILADRVAVLDGGLGTMIQRYGLKEVDFRGEEFASWSVPLNGCNDLLALTRSDIITAIHGEYLDAGADIITTDSFNSNCLSLADYGLQDYAYRISRAAAEIARRAADDYSQRTGERKFVSGSVGPTNKSASIAADMDDTAKREVSFDELVEAYTPQIEGLVDGGADIIQLETFFDTLNCKAAIFAAETVFENKGCRLPVIVSGTLTNSGRTLSGQTVEAFYASVVHAEPLAVGFNCSFGAKQLLPYLKRLAEVSDYPVSVYPNAGLPNLAGEYDETPEKMAADVEEYLKLGLVNIIGGCCGTTPAHIRAIAQVAHKYKARRVPEERRSMMLAGLEPLTVDDNADFISIGERTNVAGSAKFAKLIREGKYDEALSVARVQIEGGAQLIDICFDDGMINGVEAMRRFLCKAAAEPEIARVPVMIDSSSWEVLEAGLQCVQGKSVINSISLKEGEEEFLRRARLVKRYGAAVVVMLFDERGQADTYERKIEVAARAYSLLTGIGFPSEDIIFDPNVLAVATGISEHDRYGRDFIEAARWIRENLAGVGISGGISNLSFAFRGIDKVRRAMHSVFLYHGKRAGLNFGIVNPAMTVTYDEIEPELLELAEDVVLARREDAAERLAEYAERVKNDKDASVKGGVSGDEWRNTAVGERIAYAMLKGIDEYIAADAMEAASTGMTPLQIIDGYFMPAMERVGVMFGEGRMFLPQVVKTARVMKRGVGSLEPLLSAGEAGGVAKKEKILIATVKGDVHDIGKNIVSVVMSCNGYFIKDLGVMVECDDIVNAAVEWGADAIGLSALITPSLEEMIKVVKELQRRGLRIPVIVGGATTSGVHTAVKIAPEYSGLVIHSRDASENVVILGRLFGEDNARYEALVRSAQKELRDAYSSSCAGRQMRSLEEARANRHIKDVGNVVAPLVEGVFEFDNFPVYIASKYIDWRYFLSSWGFKGRYEDLTCSCEKGDEARSVLADARALLERIEAEELLKLKAVVGIFPAVGRGDDIVVNAPGGQVVVLPQLRNQSENADENLSLADYVAAEGDYICAFALSAGFGLAELTQRFRSDGDEYSAIMAKLLADRLTEAFAEAIHTLVRRDLWGFEDNAPFSADEAILGKYAGRRMAFGYPAVPDHSLKKEVFGLLGVQERTGMVLTDNNMINPGESLCGLIFADSDMRYFDVGRIDEHQLADYARRREVTQEEARRLLPKSVM